MQNRPPFNMCTDSKIALAIAEVRACLDKTGAIYHFIAAPAKMQGESDVLHASVTITEGKM